MWEKVMIHSYSDNYYAQIEEIREPRLKEKIMVVCNQQHQIISVNFKAEACGMKKGISLKQAKQQCPEVVVVFKDEQRAYAYQKRMIDIFNDYSDDIKVFNDDEMVVDLSSSYLLFGEKPELIAKEIQKRIADELGLKVSLGVSFCEEMARLCHCHHDMMVVGEYNYRYVMDSLLIDSLTMLPMTTVKKLHHLGFMTMGDLFKCSSEELNMIFKDDHNELYQCLCQLQKQEHPFVNMIYHLKVIANHLQDACQHFYNRLNQTSLSKSQTIQTRACYKS